MIDGNIKSSSLMNMEEVLNTIHTRLETIKKFQPGDYTEIVKSIISDHLRRRVVGYYTPHSLLSLKDYLNENITYRDFLFDITDIVSVQLAVLNNDVSHLSKLVSLTVRALESVRYTLTDSSKLLGNEIAHAIELPETLESFILENQFIFVHYLIITYIHRLDISIQDTEMQ